MLQISYVGVLVPLAAVITIVIVVIVVICIVCVCICRRCRKKKAKAAKANGTFGAGQSHISGLTYSEKVRLTLSSLTKIRQND